MSQVWSEINKVVNVSVPYAHVASTSYYTDIVNMENYKKCTFILALGASAADSPVITVVTGTSSTATITTAIPFKYRTQVLASDATSASGDVPSALTTTTGTAGFAMSSGKVGGVYMIEVDASDVAAGTTGTTYYDHVALKVSTGATSNTHTYSIIAVLSEPRYPQAILQTAID